MRIKTYGGKQNMEKMIKWIYARIWVMLRLLRLRFVRMPVPEDAKTQEQMLKEIREKSGLA